MATSDTTFERWLKNQAIDPDQLSPEQLAGWCDAYNEPPDPIDANNRLGREFINYGFQYYVAGRCAVATSLNPVAANLIHHAVEMFLKAGLCAHTNERQRRDLGHDLTRLMDEFKLHFDPEGNLAQFDDRLRELQKYEDIRYPEGTMRSGAIGLYLQFGGAPMPREPVMLSGRSDLEEYRLVMSEIDALVKAVCEAAKFRNLKSLTMMYREPGKSYLREQNAEASLFE
jgi:hypothetical protein